MKKSIKNTIYLYVIYIFFTNNILAESNILQIQSTTSIRDSGLYEFILPEYEKKYNAEVHVVAVGTGQALQNAKNCDGDILIVHATDLEEKFVDEGYGISRNDLMYNDFIIVGPQNDPASINTANNALDALNKIVVADSKFISRGDNSGTHISELNLWKLMGFNPSIYSGQWYLESGQGMGATLNIAVGMIAYSYTDRATWVRFKNKQNHRILFEGDPNLHNQYGIIKLNPLHCKEINHFHADKFHDWILSIEGQDLINKYRVQKQQLFTPNYSKD